MAQERDELLAHEYDGIREYDNPLPRWWLWLFYGTVVFALVYTPYYLLGFGPTEAEMYQEEMAAARKAYPQQAATAPAPGAAAPGTPGAPAAPSLADLSMKGNPQAIAAGKTLFLSNCKPCHGEHGQGIIGPNLTDDYWLHGNTFQDIVHTIYHGVSDKGMPTWGPILGPKRVNEVAAYVMTLHGTNPPNPKPPQGKKYTY